MNKLSIIIVSWNVCDLLDKCLASIYRYQDNLSLEIFVVDNASGDKTIEMITKKYPQVILIKNKKNIGFAKANNQAIKKATGDYILFLNPDTEIISDALGKAVKFMVENKNCGLLGVKLLNSDGSIQPSVRLFPTIVPIALILLKAPKFFKKIPAIDRYLMKDFDYNKNQEVDQVMGAFMLTKKEVLKKAGEFDERFFIWFEEVDYCRRVWQVGYSVCYNCEIRIVHYGGQSFSKQQLISKQWRFFVSAFKYFLKHGLYPKIN